MWVVRSFIVRRHFRFLLCLVCAWGVLCVQFLREATETAKGVYGPLGGFVGECRFADARWFGCDLLRDVRQYQPRLIGNARHALPARISGSVHVLPWSDDFENAMCWSLQPS